MALRMERENATIGKVLRAIVTDYEDRDLMLLFVIMSYRSSVHDSSLEISNKVMTGRQIDLPLDVMTRETLEFGKEHASE